MRKCDEETKESTQKFNGKFPNSAELHSKIKRVSKCGRFGDHHECIFPSESVGFVSFSFSDV